MASKVLSAVFTGLLISIVVSAQGTKIRDLPALTSAPSSSDVMAIATSSPVTTKKVDMHTLAAYMATDAALVPSSRTITCASPLRCNNTSSATLSSSLALSISGLPYRAYNVVDYGAVCDGSTDDHVAIDNAVSALQFNSGGILIIPGICVYNGAGIVNNPAVGITSPMMIAGNGPTVSELVFTGCSNSQCILLASQSSVGSGHNDGSGIRDLTLVGVASKPVVKISALEKFSFNNTYTYGGSTGLIVSESRQGNITNSVWGNYSSYGVDVVGDTFSANNYSNLLLTSTSAVTGIRWIKTSLTDTGGIFFINVTVNGVNTGSGFLFSASSLNSMFIFCDVCVADGSFAEDSFRFVKTQNVYMTNPFAVNGSSVAASSTLTLNASSDVTILGGVFSSGAAAGEDINLLNTNAKVVIVGPRFTGANLPVRVDSTTHDVDIRPSFYNQTTFCNDFTKIVPSASVRYSSPFLFLTGSTKATMIGLQDPAGSNAQYIDANSSGDVIHYANNGTTALATLTQAGRYGIGTTSPDSQLVVSTNSSNTLQTPLTGTIAHMVSADSVATRFMLEAHNASPVIDYRFSAGTAASPTAILASGVMGGINFLGRGSTSYSSTPRAAFRGVAGENWSDTAQGTLFTFSTTPTGSTTLTEYLNLDGSGHEIFKGTTPSISCTGTGTSPGAPTISGVDMGFVATINTGTGSPGSSGTCTITFAGTTPSFGSAPPIVCMLVKGATQWGNGATIQLTTESATAPVFTWTNLVGGVATALTVSTSYKFNCIAHGK